MMTTLDRLEREAMSADIPDAYDMTFDQMVALIDTAKHGNPFRAVHLAFRFGFSIGCRKTQKEAATAATVTTSDARD